MKTLLHSLAISSCHYGLSPNKNIRQIKHDLIAAEEPLEIILDHKDQKPLSLAITMRTPGNDEDLATGFLFSEGIITNKAAIGGISKDKESPSPQNTLVVTLTEPLSVAPGHLQRHFFTNSSCGVCGKTSIRSLEMLHRPELTSNKPIISATLLQQLPARLRQQQEQFAMTGGVHAAALFSPHGELLLLREDVGRHNAMDKLIGSLLLSDQLGIAKDSLILVSGRSSFELVQKALMADIPFLAAIGAPSSLAVQLAQRHGMTLAGFLKPDGFNVYSAPERIF